MKGLSWETINNDIENLYYSIFKDYNLNDLSKFEKRNIIFDYITSNIKYDFKALQRIRDSENHKTKRLVRDLHLEFLNALYNHIGICNAITQLYVLLLEKAGIYAMQTCSSDGSEVLHAYAMVQSSNGNFSFDDPTSVIVKKGPKSNFFNYTIEEAHKNGQAREPKFMWNDNIYFCIIDIEALFFFLQRKDTTSYYANLLKIRSNNIKVSDILSLIEKASC